MENQVLSFEEIKRLFPDEQVLLGNPLIEQTKVLLGIPIYHAQDKRDIAASGVNWRENLKEQQQFLQENSLKIEEFGYDEVSIYP